MSSNQGRDTIFTNVNLRTIIPPKHILKKTQEQIQTQQGYTPVTATKGKEIFNDRGKKKYEQTKSIDFSRSQIDDFTVQKKAMGTYNTEYLRRQLETNPNMGQQGRNQENKKIKTYFNDPSIKQNYISKDFQVKPEGASDSKINSRPNYYLSSKNIQRTLNQTTNTPSQSSKQNSLSMTQSNLSAFDQYKSLTKQDNNSGQINTNNIFNNAVTHKRCNTEHTGIFNQSTKIPYKNIHTNKVGITSTGAGFYIN